MSEVVAMDELVGIARAVVAECAPDARVRLGKISESPSARIEWDTDSAISTFLFWAAGKTYSEVMDVEEEASTLRALHETFTATDDFRALVKAHLAFVASA
ncbi:hypothetical protein GEU84_008865 [Fertoebacter nigrum]|uniref:Uncharacterized protein n=1 Tax=Fertoeibacter niger TaxID=2656921 RepID=A0A8X8H733_9RHOB|nr:hypothetical protein [Fertoeibacter niger]NUB44491.1 hypothetical protein [Fertoeibacter niger]